MSEAIELTGRLVCATHAEADIVVRHLPEHLALTRAEPGCVRFDVDPTDDPLVWRVSERFASKAAFDAHGERVRSSEWGRATATIARDYVVDTVPDA